MKFSNIIKAMLLGSCFLVNVNIAHAEGCSLEGVILKCNAEAKTAEAILNAFSSEKTRELLSSPLSRLDQFSQNGDLENYRKSMERNWLVITRLARKQERDRDRRRLSEADYQEWAKSFQEAEKSYDVALNFYRQLHWQGKK